MRRDPELTYQGALQLLDRYDHRKIEKIDKLLGGIILGAGAAAGISALFGLAVAPLGLAAIWSWVGQKDEAIKLLRSVVEGISNHLLGKVGYERYQLILAAHTTIVAASFFEALEQYLGRARYTTLQITDTEHASLAFGPDSTSGRLVQTLYDAPVPAPSPTRGFEESIPFVAEWISTLAISTEKFLEGLAVWKEMEIALRREKQTPDDKQEPTLGDNFRKLAVDHYRSNYLRIAAKVPEFFVWAALGEHAATRRLFHVVSDEIGAALKEQAAALARLESILSLSATAHFNEAGRNLCDVLRKANRGVLNEFIIPEGGGPYSYTEVQFPTVERIYLSPRYRIAIIGDSPRPADESWWEDYAVYSDLDLRLAGQLTAYDSMHMPLLLLGHPGAGKSLLTQVVAARLPPSAFTAVRVQLRRVRAEAPVYEQIQEALNDTTHGRVDWWQLADQSRATIRVVFLDGLDELLQAAGNRGNYLQELAEFQRREAEQERPVIVIVTSRTVIADRIVIPPGTTVIKLEGFNDKQIEKWLEIWNEVNQFRSDPDHSDRALTIKTALSQRELASQPLLLLMLALYSAEPTSRPIDSSLSSADLYRRLLDLFIKREVAKAKRALSHENFEVAVKEQDWRLSVTAFAMFNRGRQDITEAELRADLTALDNSTPSTGRRTPIDVGQQLIGRFFFVYVAEGLLRHPQDIRRCYEFLHATFGEYLMASYMVKILSRIAECSASDVASSEHGDLLYAFVSHQPLATTKSTLKFAAELFAELPGEDRAQILLNLEKMLASFRERHSSEIYFAYRPTPIDHVRELAAYSANLMLLRILLDDDDEGFELSHLCPPGEDPIPTWRSTVALWRAGLDANGFQAVLSELVYKEGLIQRKPVDEEMPTERIDILQSRLINDKEAESRLRFGVAIREGFLYCYPNDRWEEVVLSILVPLLATHGSPMASNILFDAVEGLHLDSVQFVDAGARSGYALDADDIVMRFFIMRCHELPLATAKSGAMWLLGARKTPRRPWAMAALVAAHPELLDILPELRDPSLYDKSTPLMLQLSPKNVEEPLRRLAQSIELHYYPTNDIRYNYYKFTRVQLDVIEAVLAAHRVELIGEDPSKRNPSASWPGHSAEA